MTMEILNGYTVIADRQHPRRPDERVILAVREIADGHEYVVAATAHRAFQPTSWHSSGHYTSSLRNAVQAYYDR